MTVAEIRARNAMKAEGKNPDSPAEVLALRTQVSQLTNQVESLTSKKLDAKLSPVEMRKSLDSLLEFYQIEPAEELIKAATEKTVDGRFALPVGDRMEIWSTLLQYRMPKLKATEISGKVDQNITIKVLHFGTKQVIKEKVIDINPD